MSLRHSRRKQRSNETKERFERLQHKGDAEVIVCRRAGHNGSTGHGLQNQLQIVMLVAFTDFLTLASSAIGLLLTTMLGLIFRQRRSGTVIVTPLKPALIAKKRAPQGGTNGDSEVFLTAAELVARYCPSLSSSSFTSYRPSWWLPGGHLQTFYCVAGNFNEIDKVDYVRTTLRLPDGGTVSADVSPPDHTSLPDDAPTVIIAHGLTGGSHESYVRNVVEWIVRPRKEGGLGGRAVVANVSRCPADEAAAD